MSNAMIRMHVMPGTVAALKAATRAATSATAAENALAAIEAVVGSGVMSAGVYDPQEIQADAFARENHTGFQSISTITGLQDRIDWLRRGYCVLEEGADPTGQTLTQDAIQAALNKVRDAGGGMVFAPACPPGGFYALGLTAETYPTTYMPVPYQQNYGLLIPEGVMLVGEGRATHFKRAVADPAVVMIAPSGDGTQMRNLRVDGNNTEFPITGDTYGSGAGIGIESTSVTSDRETVVDNVWIDDTPGYGVGVEWGNHRGCTLRNIFIDGTGSDAIDIKRMNDGSFDAYAITVDNIHITRHGRTATDVATQTGLDIRGYVTASNIHIHGEWGARASAGIRMHDTGGGVIGGHYSSVTGFYVERASGGYTSTYGILNNGARYGSFMNGSARGAHFNFSAVGLGGLFTNCRSVGALTAGFSDSDTANASRYVACSTEGDSASIGFYISGDNAKLAFPYATGTATGISIASTAGNTELYSPSYSGNTVDLADASTSTSIISGNQVQYSGITTATTVGAAGGATALPATPRGYKVEKINGTLRKIPFYDT